MSPRWRTTLLLVVFCGCGRVGYEDAVSCAALSCGEHPDGGAAGAGIDADGDGVNASLDCADDRANVFPGAREVCNARDDDCDGDIDEEGCPTLCFPRLMEARAYLFCISSETGEAERLTWIGSRNACAAYGYAGLATIDSSAKDVWVSDRLGELTGGLPLLWHEGSDRENEGEWMRRNGQVFWRQGATVAGAYAAWTTTPESSPNASLEDCVSYRRFRLPGSTFTALRCDEQHGFICEE